MKFKYLFIVALLVLGLASCEDDDENLNGIGKVTFPLTNLVEVENATNALNINIGIDDYNHAGGTIEVAITGGDYGVDYETSQGAGAFVLDIAAQALVSTFSLRPVDDETSEVDTQLTITITNVTGALELGDHTVLNFTIIDNDDPLMALVGFENDTEQINEDQTNSTSILIPFDQATTDGGTITMSSSGDAVYGTDYTITGETSGDFVITVPAGATAASFAVQPIDNAVFEANKTVGFSINEVSGGLGIGVTTQTTITIVNDDSPPNPVIDFSASNILTYTEAAGTITLNFDISQVTTADATIELTTSGSADTADYNFNGSTTNPYSFVIPSGSTTGSVDITIVDDADIETEETIVLAITSVSGGLDVGLNLQSQTITITDNDDAAFAYVETFETVSDLPSSGFEAFLLPTQDLPSTKLFKYNVNVGKYADVDAVNQTSDSGLVVFYNTTQNGNGVLDNVVITPLMEVSGDVNVSIDLSYAQAPAVNNAVVTFYYSETYNGSGSWDASDWSVMGTETAADMNADGIGTGDYKRKVMSISPSTNFYVAVRVHQTIDDTFTKTQWRLDNFKVNN